MDSYTLAHQKPQQHKQQNSKKIKPAKEVTYQNHLLITTIRQSQTKKSEVNRRNWAKMIEIEQKQQTQITIPCLKSMRMETQIAHNLHSIVANAQSPPLLVYDFFSFITFFFFLFFGFLTLALFVLWGNTIIWNSKSDYCSSPN